MGLNFTTYISILPSNFKKTCELPVFLQYMIGKVKMHTRIQDYPLMKEEEDIFTPPFQPDLRPRLLRGFRPPSSVLHLHSSILHPQSSILNPQSSVPLPHTIISPKVFCPTSLYKLLERDDVKTPAYRLLRHRQGRGG